jgi:hypothetical protein
MNLTPDLSATPAPSGEPEFYASERNLNLLSERDFAPFVPPGSEWRTERFRLFGPISNLMFLIRNAPDLSLRPASIV